MCLALSSMLDLRAASGHKVHPSRPIRLFLLSEVKCPLLPLDAANGHDSLLSLNYVLCKWKKNIMTIALYLVFLFISEIRITYAWETTLRLSVG